MQNDADVQQIDKKTVLDLLGNYDQESLACSFLVSVDGLSVPAPRNELHGMDQLCLDKPRAEQCRIIGGSCLLTLYQNPL